MVVNTEMDSMYLENLDKFINDEGKIVTYKWLSLTLDVPANVAKQMLYHFVEKQRNKDNDSLNVTYLLSGVADGEQGKVHKVMVVREENLEVVKRTLKEIISVHVYSVAKSKLSDLATLYTANYDITKSNLTSITKHSGIECSTAKVRSAEDLIKLQKQQAYQPPVEVSILPPKTKVSPKKEMVNKPAAKGKSNQISNMFSKQIKKEETKSEIKSEKDTSKPSKPSAAASKNKGGGISSFFTKGPTVVKPTTKSPESVLSTPKSESSETDNDATPTIKTEKKEKKEIKEESSEEMDTDQSPVVKSPIKTEIKKEVKNESPKKEIKKESHKKEIKKEFGNSKTKSKVSKKRKTLSEDPQPKKRSRIMQMSDSESSDGEQEESDEESPFPPNPEPEKARIDSDSEDEVIPSTPEKEDKSDTRGRKKKLVDKTYMDEDGFLVTKKEYEFVDGSEDEKETKSKVEAETKSKDSPKKVEEQPKKSEPSPVKKNKQANIMSFFKKK